LRYPTPPLRTGCVALFWLFEVDRDVMELDPGLGAAVYNSMNIIIKFFTNYQILNIVIQKYYLFNFEEFFFFSNFVPKSKLQFKV